jgi:hypothetical protein
MKKNQPQTSTVKTEAIEATESRFRGLDMKFLKREPHDRHDGGGHDYHFQFDFLGTTHQMVVTRRISCPIFLQDRVLTEVLKTIKDQL